MSAIVLLLLVVVAMIFMLLLSKTMTEEFRLLFVRVIELIPHWDANHADLKGFAFSVSFMLWVLGIFIVVFR